MEYRDTKDAEGKPFDIERVEELYRFLQGGDVEGVTISSRQKVRLSRRKAFSIIWFLQEHMNILPSRFEQCCRCGDLYDDHREGRYVEKTGRHYCGSCN